MTCIDIWNPIPRTILSAAFPLGVRLTASKDSVTTVDDKESHRSHHMPSPLLLRLRSRYYVDCVCRQVLTVQTSRLVSPFDELDLRTEISRRRRGSRLQGDKRRELLHICLLALCNPDQCITPDKTPSIDLLLPRNMSTAGTASQPASALAPQQDEEISAIVAKIGQMFNKPERPGDKSITVEGGNKLAIGTPAVTVAMASPRPIGPPQAGETILFFGDVGGYVKSLTIFDSISRSNYTDIASHHPIIHRVAG